MQLRFTKMQGLGNDFVVVDAIRQPVALTAEQVRALADRHFGIGCDQLLLLEPSALKGVHARYRIFNADGGEVEHCGNGVRCVAHYLLAERLASGSPVCVELFSGGDVVEIVATDDGMYRVDMGEPMFEPDAIPLAMPARTPTYQVELEGASVEFASVSMSNPHAVVTVADVSTAPVASWGPKLESHAVFPARVNVGFMQVVGPNEIRLRVFERGAGETLACGTGACAAAATGIANGTLQSPVAVDLPGGRLKIEWAGPGHRLYMTGPAVRVFEGVVAL
ncbi:MAG: diaminopimelate epimerase [Gammaproteobacteria bacterium]|nr:diaminopimelate epimerase [Gammaproteobacteria bacterium]